MPQPHLFPHAPLSEDTILVPSVRLPVEPLPEGFPREEDKVVVVGRSATLTIEDPISVKWL